MTKREIIRSVLAGEPPPYVPWNISLTLEAKETLERYYGGTDALNQQLDNHIVGFGSGIGECADEGNQRYRDIFGVVWDRSKDKDIGVVDNIVLKEAKLGMLALPDPQHPKLYADLERAFDHSPEGTAGIPDGFRVFHIGFSLFERAWTLRGMENLLIDFIENPGFAKDLLRMIADFNIAVVRKAAAFDIDAVYFGDDWGQQNGLIMGPYHWKEFIYPELKRMYNAVRQAGKEVFVHSCGDVDELFDDLIDIGLGCFNPFQPEVMDVPRLLEHYRGRLTFHGGLSTQRTLPYGSPDEVRKETRHLLELGRQGGYIFAPAHSIEGDVPLENMVAMLEELRR